MLARMWITTDTNTCKHTKAFPCRQTLTFAYTPVNDISSVTSYLSSQGWHFENLLEKL